MREAPTDRGLPSYPPPSVALPRAVSVFYQYVLERPDVERLVRYDRLEPAVPFFQLPEPPQLGYLEASVLIAPVVERRLGNAVAAAQLGRLGACFRFLQDRDDLLFTESSLLHACLPSL